MNEKDILRELAEKGFEAIGETEAERSIFGGQTQREAVGLFATDPATQEMIRKMFALGRNMGLSKDEIKLTYHFDSFKKLTVKEGLVIIKQMMEDSGETDEPVKRSPAPQTDESLKSAKWTKAAGVNLINGTIAKCGACKFYNGACEKGIVTGRIDKNKMCPINKDCFVFAYGELSIEAPKQNKDSF